jgi:hypothetical protein
MTLHDVAGRVQSCDEGMRTEKLFSRDPFFIHYMNVGLSLISHWHVPFDQKCYN